MPRLGPLVAIAGILGALLVPPRAWAQEPPPPADDAALAALVASSGDQDANGGADTVVVMRRTVVTVEESGLAWFDNHEIVKCLSEKGAASLARIRLDYDPSSNEVTVDRFRVIRADGSILDLPAKTLDLPQPQRGIYWGARMLQLPVPRLVPGDAVEIRTTMKGFLIAYLEEPGSKIADRGPHPGDDSRFVPPMRGHFYDVVTFHQADVPVRLRHYTVRTPRDKPIQFEVYNGEVKSYVTVDDEHNVYRFWREEVPAFEREDRLALSASDVAPKVVLATVPDWPAKSRWFCEVNARQFEADEAIRAKVAEITRGLRTDDDRIAAIVHWAADEIRYSGITMGKGEGYTLHPGPMIFRDRSGVCKDKAGMAITMLRAAGYTVYPAMTMAGARVERIPADQFNHCVGAVRRDDGSWQLIDPTWVVLSPETWSSREGQQHYVIGTPDGEDLMLSPAFRAEDNALYVRAASRLAANGDLAGTLVITASGAAEQQIRRDLAQGLSTRQRQAWFEELVARIAPGASVDPVEVRYADLKNWRKPIRLEVSYRIPGFAMVGLDGRIRFAPPTARHLLAGPRLAPHLDVPDRDAITQGLMLWIPRMTSMQETIALPAGFRVARLPAGRNLDNAMASFEVRAETSGRSLSFTHLLTVKERIVPPEAWPDLREVVRVSRDLEQDLVVLERRER
ncbi:MAG: DUF3857 and transglutaminase domain-containing protein [Deltaproteobacteria bacterium]|nr:DUF3857 and transglutaminase domain-containing protein [Deltaproteobacteria bacterium]